MAMSSSSGFEQWVYGMADLTTVAMPKWILGEAHRFDPTGFVSAMLLCSANGISAIYSILTKNITMRLGQHLSLHKDAPIRRTMQTVGRTLAMPVLGGLHHQYFGA